MPWSDLPTSISPGDTGHIAHHDTIHGAINGLVLPDNTRVAQYADLAGRLILPDGSAGGKHFVGDAVPTSPSAGDLWTDTAERHFDMSTVPGIVEFGVTPTANSYTRSVVSAAAKPDGSQLAKKVLQITTADVNGSDRRLLQLSDFPLDLDDSEITSLWYARNNGVGSVAQPGHFHRLQNTGTSSQIAVAVYEDATFNQDAIINIGLWKGNASITQIQASNITFDGLSSWQCLLTTIALTSNVVTLTFDATTPPPYRAGDIIDVNTGNAIFDGRFRVTAYNPASRTVSYAKTHADVGSVGNTGFVRGTMPMWVTSRLIGNTIWVKAWAHRDAEPSWSNPNHVESFTFTDGATPTGAGHQGIIQSHIDTGEVVQYGPITVSRPEGGGLKRYTGSAWVPVRTSRY